MIPPAHSAYHVIGSIRPLHVLQRPLRIANANIGTFSQALSRRRHEGQADGGQRIDAPSRLRSMETAANDPMEAPAASPTAPRMPTEPTSITSRRVSSLVRRLCRDQGLSCAGGRCRRMNPTRVPKRVLWIPKLRDRRRLP